MRAMIWRKGPLQVGYSTRIRSTTSERGCFSQRQSFDNLQASEFAATQVVPTAGVHSGRRGGCGVYVRAERFVTSPRIGYASRLNGQLTAEVSHLLDLQPCWLLLGLAPTGKRRLLTAHTQGGHRTRIG